MPSRYLLTMQFFCCLQGTAAFPLLSGLSTRKGVGGPCIEAHLTRPHPVTQFSAVVAIGWPSQ
jgi:hypothetical protein